MKPSSSVIMTIGTWAAIGNVCFVEKQSHEHSGNNCGGGVMKCCEYDDKCCEKCELKTVMSFHSPTPCACECHDVEVV